MKKLALVLTACCVMITTANAQIDPIASSATPIGGPGWLMNCPQGDGHQLLSTGMVGILVRVVDVTGAPVVGLTARDFEVDGFVPFSVIDAFFPGGPAWDVTSGGFAAVGPGLYRIDGTLWAGGSEPGNSIVKVRGVQLFGAGPLPLRMVSPDLNADGIINLTDVAQFAAAYGGPYTFRADFNGDGVVNLVDITLLVPHMGHALPAGAVGDPVD